MAIKIKGTYETWRWKKERAQFLKGRPQCVRCGGKATLIDHIVRWRRAPDPFAAFWDQANWQPMCKRCHDKYKALSEATGKATEHGCNEDGTPTDPAHHWAQKPPE